MERERPLTDYEKQLLREIQDLKNRQEMMVAPAPPPPKYSDSVENWQKGLETVAYDMPESAKNWYDWSLLTKNV